MTGYITYTTKEAINKRIKPASGISGGRYDREPNRRRESERIDEDKEYEQYCINLYESDIDLFYNLRAEYCPTNIHGHAISKGRIV